MAGWTSRAARPVAAGWAIGHCASPDGKIWALGGITAVSGFNPTGTLTHHVYDPTTNTWTAKANYPVADANGGGVQNPAYVNIGASANMVMASNNSFSAAVRNNVYSYSISGNTWTAKAALPATEAYVEDPIWDGSDTVYLLKTGGGTQTNYKYSIAGNSYTTFSVDFDNYSRRAHWYNGKIWGPTKYYDPGTNTATTYSDTAFLTTDTIGIYNGKLYQSYEPIGFESEDPADWGKIVAIRDLTTAPYAIQGTAYSESGPFTVSDYLRTAPDGGSTYKKSPQIGIAGQYYYRLAGYVSVDPDSGYTGKLDLYDLVFANAPTSVTPAASAVVNNDLATVTAVVPANGERQWIEIQLARDAAFTTNLRTITPFTTVEYFGDYIFAANVLSPGETQTRKLKAGTEELFQGTWYIRTRGRNSLDASPWSATQSFTVSHPPAVSLSSPVGGGALDWGASGAMTFQWGFSDTSETDYQTAYQLICERVDTNAVVLDTGKVVSQTARSYNWSVPSGLKDIGLRWKMRAWDSDDVAGAYTAYATFSSSDKPVANITAPAEGAQVNNGQPTVTWTFSASGGRTQAKYRVVFLNNSNTILYDSGTIVGNALTYTPPQQVIGVGNFKVQVYLTDGGGLVGTDTNNFSTSFSAPAEPAFTTSSAQYSTSGYNLISWTDAQKDGSWVGWRVYRRLVGATTWERIYNTTSTATSFAYQDYSAGSGVAYQYIVVQVALRFGSEVESAMTNPQTITGTSDQYWLVDRDTPANNMLLPNVTADSFRDEWESETLLVIGRGRHKDIGTHYGNSGTLEIKLRGPSARAKRLALLALQLNQAVMLLRNPFGDVWRVSLGDADISRISGVGTTEMCDVSLPYEEVS